MVGVLDDDVKISNAKKREKKWFKVDQLKHFCGLNCFVIKFSSN